MWKDVGNKIKLESINLSLHSAMDTKGDHGDCVNISRVSGVTLSRSDSNVKV